MATYLDFEHNIKELDEAISNAKMKGDAPAIEILNKFQSDIEEVRKSINAFTNMRNTGVV